MPYRFISTFSYIGLILVINLCFSYLPSLEFVGGNQISLADFLVGLIYLTRDFAQRQIGHYVLIAMLIGGGLSYWLADPIIATASITAFIVAESVDWGVFTLTGWPLSKRLLYSAGMSAPIDTYVFLKIADQYNFLEFSIMTLVKWLGVIVLWWFWHQYPINRSKIKIHPEPNPPPAS